MSQVSAVVITGLGYELPGIPADTDLLAVEAVTVPGPFAPEQRLGRSGLRYKDRATKLALCAASAALEHAGLAALPDDEAAVSGVVVSSSLGNLDSICAAVQTLRDGSTDDLSPMSLPNLSSNIIASTVAIRFKLQAVNITLCNGASSGTEALYLAANALRAERACRMLVIGVEPYNEVVQQLIERGWQGAPGAPPRLGEGAACLVLEPLERARARGAAVYGQLTGYSYAAPGHDPRPSVQRALAALGRRPQLWLTPGGGWPAPSAPAEHPLADPAAAAVDLTARLGELYSALGVFQCLAACQWLAGSDQRQLTLASSGGGWGDGTASICVQRVVLP